MAEKKKVERFLTGRGVAVYPRLESPDTKFKAEGKYSTKLRQSAEAGAALKARIDKAAQAAFDQAKAELTEKAKDSNSDVSKRAKLALKKLKIADLPYSEDEDTGDITFSFGMTASGVNKKTGKAWTRTPAIFDAKGVILKNVPRIGAGSELNVSYEFTTFSTAIGCGVSLRLAGVQVLKLVEWTAGGNAKAYGFEAEDGYEAGESEFETASAPSSDEETSDEGDTDEESTSDDADF